MSLFIYSLNFKTIILVVALMQRFKNCHFCWFCMGNGCAEPRDVRKLGRTPIQFRAKKALQFASTPHISTALASSCQVKPSSCVQIHFSWLVGPLNSSPNFNASVASSSCLMQAAAFPAYHEDLIRSPRRLHKSQDPPKFSRLYISYPPSDF